MSENPTIIQNVSKYLMSASVARALYEMSRIFQLVYSRPYSSIYARKAKRIQANSKISNNFNSRLNTSGKPSTLLLAGDLVQAFPQKKRKTQKIINSSQPLSLKCVESSFHNLKETTNLKSFWSSVLFICCRRHCPAEFFRNSFKKQSLNYTIKIARVRKFLSRTNTLTHAQSFALGASKASNFDSR